MKTWMKIDLPDGTTTNGVVDHRHYPKRFKLDQIDLKGKRILDIASNDGFWAFWAKQNGADYVLSTEIENFKDYDWGYYKPKQYQDLQMNHNVAFEELREILNLDVERKTLSVYDHDPEKIGTFDFVVMSGLLYHLRHPLKAIDTLRKVCNDEAVAFIKTHCIITENFIPLNIFYEDDVMEGADSNWTGANIHCIAAWMKNAGFKHIFIQKPFNDKGYCVLNFFGCTGDKYKELFIDNEELIYCDEAYFQKCHKETEKFLDGNIKI